MNTDPLQAIQQGQLRQDIYYRLSMMSVHIPPLRERKADIPAFLNFYINKHNATFHKNIEYVSRELISNLESYSWPGNLRELEHTIVYAMSHVSPHEHVLQVKDLREPLSTSPHPFWSIPAKSSESCRSFASSASRTGVRKRPDPQGIAGSRRQCVPGCPQSPDPTSDAVPSDPGIRPFRYGYSLIMLVLQERLLWLGALT